TGEPIGRSRWGADCAPDNRRLWEIWWAKYGKTFTVPSEKPASSWVPGYPKHPSLARPAELVLPKLLAAFGDKDIDVRRAALEGIGQLGPAGQGGLPHLTRALQDPDVTIRREAATALERMHDSAGPARRELLAAMRDSDDRVRTSAASA